MPTVWVPWPGNRNTTGRARRPTPGPVTTRPEARWARASAAAAGSRRSTTAARRWAKAVRPTPSVKAAAAGAVAQEAGQPVGGHVEGGGGAGRHREQHVVPLAVPVLGRGRGRRLLHHQVGVGAADAERADPGPAGPGRRIPVGQRGVDVEG